MLRRVMITLLALGAVIVSLFSDEPATVGATNDTVIVVAADDQP